jgi:soluble lytic murein transglycosylase
MILKQFQQQLPMARQALPVIASLMLLATAQQGFSASGADESVLGAYDAYRAGDAMKLAKQAKKLEGHALTPWLDYWRVALRLEDASARDVNQFFADHGDTYVAELLRADWAKVLGKRRAWQDFDREAAKVPRPDLEIRCYGLSSRIAAGDDSALAEAEAVWLEPNELPEGCARLADTLMKRGRISITDTWRRVRVLFEDGHITAAKTALGYLPKKEGPDERALAEAARTPKRLIARLPASLEQRAAREVAVLAGVRYAKADPEGAAKALEGALGARLPDRELKYLWSRVAYEGAHLHHDQALKWYARAGNTPLDDEELGWKVRAGLRRGQWSVVRSSIDRMSPAAKQEAAWVYWYGRGLAAQGEEDGARAYYLRIAGQTDFYGLLASEELGYVATIPEPSYVPTEEEVAAASRVPGLVRALELIRLGMRTEGVREWLFTLRSFDDRRLLAAAELARRADVYDRAIQAADRTERLHNYSLRYPVPYRDIFEEYARTQQLDLAWVLGLVRQESRFVSYARSGAGAAGLMQVMPHTARYVASRMKMRNFRPRHMTDVQTNVTLGTGYMKMVLEQLGHPVLASAAYNAGPARAKRWRSDRPLEGAVYVETIPFGETREYVKKVTANSVFYAALLEKRVTPLKERLGTIPARAAGEPPEEDDEEEEPESSPEKPS